VREGAEMAVRPEGLERGVRYCRRDRPRRDDAGGRRAGRAERPERQMNGEAEAETIPFDALPPAIGRDEPEAAEAEAEEPKRPRRRARAPRPEGGEDEVAPAA
jgi:hypothetical protein